jgi:TonB-dependent starch-binding outer membrane protein SusC
MLFKAFCNRQSPALILDSATCWLRQTTTTEGRSGHTAKNLRFVTTSAKGGSGHAKKNLRFVAKIIRVMQLTTILLTVFSLTVTARSVSQSVTFSGNNTSLAEVFTAIEKQTNYTILYKKNILEHGKPVTISVSNIPLNEFLTQVFNKQPLIYSIHKNYITVEGKVNTANLNIPLSPSFVVPPVTGVVHSPNGQPIANATIVVKGTKRGTTTRTDGSFSIEANKDDILIISSIGFTDRQVLINYSDVGIVALNVSESKLDEIQVIAYGTTTQRLSTGNISSVKAVDIQKSPVTNPLLAIQGRVPGIQITQSTGFAGGGVDIVVQGLNSLQKGSVPFYVIDGVPYAQSMLPNLGNILGTSGRGAGDGPTNGSPLSYINPGDIESIEILKDADATAIYGSRAANGAILITTKKGKAGKMKLDVTYQRGLGQVARRLDLLNTKEYLEVRREAFSNDNEIIGTTDYDLNGSWDITKNTDWQKELIGKNAKYQDLQLNVTGGNDNVKYLVGGLIHQENTVFPTTLNDKKAAFRFNLDAQSANKKLKLMLSSSYLSDHNRLPQADLTSYAVSIAPNMPDPLNSDGSINWGNNNAPNISTVVPNPLASLFSLYINKTKNFINNATIAHELLNGLEVKSRFGYTDLSTDEIVTTSSASIRPEFRYFLTPSANYNYNDIKSWIVEPEIAFNRTIGFGRLSAVAGASVQQSNSSKKLLFGTGYSSDLVLENIGAAKNITTPTGSSILSTYKYNAAFFRVNYNWQEKYIINITGRRDGSSRFGSNNKFHNFGAIGAAWIFSKENWLNDEFLSFGKLKASFGTTGNDQVGDYNYLSLYQNNNPEVPYRSSTSLSLNTIANPYLQWEETKKRSIGLDLGFLHDRLLFDINVYKNTSSNMLVVATLPATSGPIGGLFANLPATITNTGIELSLTTINCKKKDFTWTTSLNLTVPRNKLSKFENLSSSAYANSYVIGQPSNIIKTYSSNGVNPITGLYEFIDKDGKITNDPGSDPANNLKIINPNPSYYGGINNSIVYKHLDISFLFQYVQHLGQNLSDLAPPGYTKTNQQKFVLDRWQKEGDRKYIQKYAVSNYDYINASYIQNFSDAYWVNASYLRLKNVSISYELPAKWVSKIKVNSCRVFANGQNLLTITSYKGLDPESLSNVSLSPLRVFTFGIQASL